MSSRKSTTKTRKSRFKSEKVDGSIVQGGRTLYPRTPLTDEAEAIVRDMLNRHQELKECERQDSVHELMTQIMHFCDRNDDFGAFSDNLCCAFYN